MTVPTGDVPPRDTFALPRKPMPVDCPVPVKEPDEIVVAVGIVVAIAYSP